MSQGGMFRTLPGIPVPDSVLADLEQRIEQDRASRAQRERQQYEDVTLIVGTHNGCGGEIEYVSKFHPVGVIRLGGRNDMEEKASCHCKMCGVSFNPYFSLYRDQVTAHRNRP